MLKNASSLSSSFSRKSRERLLDLGSLESQYEETGRCMCLTSAICDKFTQYFKDFSRRALEMGRNDPRKIMHAIKMGLALSIVSLLIFWKEPFPDAAQYSIWAILTVIVMFEFSIGATFIKGFNRGLGTFCAGVLAFGFGKLALSVGKGEEIVIVTSIFLIAAIASYLKLYPGMEPYEYGYRVFVLTYCILMMAGNRNSDYTEVALTRLMLIALGAVICFIINIFIYPIWAGEDLHRLVVKNFKDLATSLEGCIKGYLQCVEYERIPSKILTYQPSDDPLYSSYRSVLESTGRENTLLGFALWEPPHGRYKMLHYPWRNYVKVSGALRHCASMVMALHGSLLSEIQAPPEKRHVFASELQRVGEEGAKVLRLLESKIEKMEKLDKDDILEQVHEAAEQLQKKIDKKSYLLVKSESWEIGKRSQELPDLGLPHENESIGLDFGFRSLSETILDMRSMPIVTTNWPTKEFAKPTLRRQTAWPSCFSLDGESIIKEDEARTYESASSLSLATFASLLIEFVARLQNLVDAFEELSEKAKFKEVITSQSAGTKDAGSWFRQLRDKFPTM
ncbi:aluminum-activated malate transporter 4 [Sesamum indicum]|uniref:Aluminum-activated malate transporter 4 n=1 Tax=Sesamum indicum TaxID=4182 RepID=A0A6I9T0Z1_SESIN|nr:aluminum-activated malate transporter 4 [Sesamum indicum]